MTFQTESNYILDVRVRNVTAHGCRVSLFMLFLIYGTSTSKLQTKDLEFTLFSCSAASIYRTCYSITLCLTTASHGQTR